MQFFKQQMLKRPKSAVLLSLPYNFQSKQQAVEIKQKVKRSLLTFERQQFLDIDIYQNKRNQSCRSYVDNGPSLLNNSRQHYSVAQINKTFRSLRSLQNSRASSAKGTRQNVKQMCTGLENYQRLKPCKSINEKSIKNLQDCLKDAKKQSKFIDRVFQNLSPRNQLIKMSHSKLFKKNSFKQKQNGLQVKGKSFDAFYETNVPASSLQQTPYKTNVFQPKLQRKGLQLLRRSKAFLMTRE